MLAELQGTHILLKRWIGNPDGAALEISPFSADRDSDRPFTRDEIARKAAFLRQHAPTAMASLDRVTEELRSARLSPDSCLTPPVEFGLTAFMTQKPLPGDNGRTETDHCPQRRVSMTPVIPNLLYRSERPGYSGGENVPVRMGEVQCWIDAAQSLGIVSIICLLDEEHLCLYPDGDLLGIYRTAGFEIRHVPVRDHFIPSLTDEQFAAVLQAYRELPKPVLMHCSAGLGRTSVACGHILDHQP